MVTEQLGDIQLPRMDQAATTFTSQQVDTVMMKAFAMVLQKVVEG